MSEKLFDRVALIGIGLIGSSLARALRRDSPETTIVACARRPETLATVRRLALADATTDDPAVAVEGADLVVIATPLSAYAELGRRIAPELRDGAILTDVGSVKQAAIRDLAAKAGMNGIAVEKRAATQPGGETFIGRGIEDHARDGTRAFDDGGADSEMRPAFHEGHGAVDGVDHKNTMRAEPGWIVQAFFRQPAIGRPGAAQRLFQEIVDRQIGFGDGATPRFVPAFVIAAEKFQRDLAGFAHRGLEKMEIGFGV